MQRTLEDFALYHRQREQLNDYLQIALAGLTLLNRNISVSNSAILLGALVDACDVSHWRAGTRYHSAAKKVDTVISILGEQGVSQQVALFDLYTRSAIQDVSRFSQRARTDLIRLNHEHKLLRLNQADRWVSHHCCNDLTDKLSGFANRVAELRDWLKWTPTPKLISILPLFELIFKVRNRIAHYAGIVGDDLETFSTSEAVANSLAAFRAHYASGDLPSLPTFVRGRGLNLKAVHAILFGAILYEIAKELNAHLASYIEDNEFIDMAFYYSCVVAEHPFRTVRHRSAENRVQYFLQHRYFPQSSSQDSKRLLTDF